jgi:hypothetical protein
MIRKITLALLAFSIATLSALACNFEFTTDGNKKSCKPGEEFVINIKLTLTHRTCTVAPALTKFKTDGFDVLAATTWKEATPGVWTRQVKVKVKPDAKKKMTLTATRTCDKEGGLGVYSLDIL